MVIFSLFWLELGMLSHLVFFFFFAITLGELKKFSPWNYLPHLCWTILALNAFVGWLENSIWLYNLGKVCLCCLYIPSSVLRAVYYSSEN